MLNFQLWNRLKSNDLNMHLWIGEPVAFAYFGYSIHVLYHYIVVCANDFQNVQKISSCAFSEFAYTLSPPSSSLCPDHSFVYILDFIVYKWWYFFFLLSFRFQVPYPMFSAIYSVQLTYLLCTHWFWNAGNTAETVNWQPLFILFTSKINLTPAQHNILDTYKMQIHLLFECGEDCFTSPVDTRFHVLLHCLCGFHPVGCLTMIS